MKMNQHKKDSFKINVHLYTKPITIWWIKHISSHFTVVSTTIQTIQSTHHTTTVKVKSAMGVKKVLRGPYQLITVLSLSSIRVKSWPRKTIKWRQSLVVIHLLTGTGNLFSTVEFTPMEHHLITLTRITCHTLTTRTCPCINTTFNSNLRKAWRPFLNTLANLALTHKLWR